MRPAVEPIGRTLNRVAKLCSRAFDDALAAAGGSQPMWLVLIALKTHAVRNQRELAAAVGVQGATLTHHLNAMEAAGLVVRRRDPANRRVHLVELTEAGEERFHDLARAATAFDERLRAGFTADEVAALAGLLGRLAANVEAG